jgi:hypothetical protein
MIAGLWIWIPLNLIILSNCILNSGNVWATEKIKFVNLHEWWDAGKNKIKSLTIEASKKLKSLKLK